MRRTGLLPSLSALIKPRPPTAKDDTSRRLAPRLAAPASHTPECRCQALRFPAGGLFRAKFQNIVAAYQFHAETAFQLGITIGETDFADRPQGRSFSRNANQETSL